MPDRYPPGPSDEDGGQQPAGQAPQNPPPPYGQPPYGQPPYGQPPYGQYGYGDPGHGNPGWGGQHPGYGPPVSKPTGWFVVNWLFFWPLAIYSLVSAWNNIDPALYAGDVAAARYHAARVRTFGIIALCVGIGLFVVGIVLDVVVFAVAVHHIDDCDPNYRTC